MTGTDFKFFDRGAHPALARLTEQYYRLSDENRDLLDLKIRYNEHSDEELDRYYANQTRMKYLALRIWSVAFYEYGRTNAAADEFCLTHGILC